MATWKKGIGKAWHSLQEQQTDCAALALVSDLMVPPPLRQRPSPGPAGCKGLWPLPGGHASTRRGWGLVPGKPAVPQCCQAHQATDTRHNEERRGRDLRRMGLSGLMTAALGSSAPHCVRPRELIVAWAQVEGPGKEASNAHQHVPGCHLRTCRFSFKVTLEKKMPFQLCPKQ